MFKKPVKLFKVFAV